MTAIETRYKGCRFRSRLEARWCVFFDTFGVKWEYETQGFDLCDGVRYLPDFWLPDLRAWVEIKPDAPLSAEDADKLARFRNAVKNTTDATGVANDVWTLAGQPGWLDDRPTYTLTGLTGQDTGEAFAECPLCRRLITADVIRLNNDWCSTTGKYAVWCVWCDCLRDLPPAGPAADGAYFHKGDSVGRRTDILSVRLLTAYAAARSARFEHGEAG